MTANTLADGSSPRWLPVLSSWTSDLPGGQDGSRGLCVQLRATTPLPLRASDSRWLSPVVVTTGAWCRSRSTVADVVFIGDLDAEQVPRPVGCPAGHLG